MRGPDFIHSFIHLFPRLAAAVHRAEAAWIGLPVAQAGQLKPAF